MWGCLQGKVRFWRLRGSIEWWAPWGGFLTGEWGGHTEVSSDTEGQEDWGGWSSCCSSPASHSRFGGDTLRSHPEGMWPRDGVGSMWGSVGPAKRGVPLELDLELVQMVRRTHLLLVDDALGSCSDTTSFEAPSQCIPSSPGGFAALLAGWRPPSR